MQSNKQSGVTLIELMVVVVIAGILAIAAGPPMMGMLNDMKQSSLVSLLVGDLNRARGEAIKRNRRVLVCVRQDDATCGAGANWANGWLICHDDNELGACDTAANSSDPQNPIVIAVRPPIASNITLASVGPLAGPVLQFNPNGTQGADTNPFILGIKGATTMTVNIAASGSITK